MSKQLTLSATVAVLSMVLLAAVTTFGAREGRTDDHGSGKAPLFELSIER